MQRIPNQNMRFIAKNTEQRNKTMEQLHEHYNVKAINVRRASKLYNKFKEKEPNIANISHIQNQNTRKDHNWWPSAAKRLCAEEPDPIYT